MSRIPVPDNVVFVMPKDRELQWASMPIVQKWVNNYEARMEKNDASSGRARFVLTYDLQMPKADFEIFQRAGLVLTQSPGMISSSPDMVIDLSDARLLRWKDSGRHVCQVCGWMCGEEASALPLIRRVHPGVGGKWGTFQPESFPGIGITEEDLLNAQDGEWEGIIGVADWRMYLASAMMFPTVELVPATRNKNWLSKYNNLGYRQIQANEGDDVEWLVQQAKTNIQAFLKQRAEAKKTQEVC